MSDNSFKSCTKWFEFCTIGVTELRQFSGREAAFFVLNESNN